MTVKQLEKSKTIFRKVKIEYEILKKDVQSLICSALEGGLLGSGEWCELVGYHYRRGVSKADFEPEGKYAERCGIRWEHPMYLVPFVLKCGLILEEQDGDEPVAQHILDADAIDRGFVVMAQKYPHHWRDFLAGKADGTTADVWLQCALLGSVQYQ